jgi:hypothetical protein
MDDGSPSSSGSLKDLKIHSRSAKSGLQSNNRVAFWDEFMGNITGVPGLFDCPEDGRIHLSSLTEWRNSFVGNV